MTKLNEEQNEQYMTLMTQHVENAFAYAKDRMQFVNGKREREITIRDDANDITKIFEKMSETKKAIDTENDSAEANEALLFDVDRRRIEEAAMELQKTNNDQEIIDEGLPESQRVKDFATEGTLLFDYDGVNNEIIIRRFKPKSSDF